KGLPGEEIVDGERTPVSGQAWVESRFLGKLPSGPGLGRSTPLDLETIKALVEVLGQSDVEELELQTAGTHLRIRRAVGPRPASVNGLVAEPSVETGGTPAAGAQPAAEESLAQPGEIVVTAPLV